MEERNISGKFLNMSPTTSAMSMDSTALTERNYTRNSLCENMFDILNILIAIFALVGLAGNAIVLWLLGFHVHRNAFSVYVLNLAGADFLYLCLQTVYSLDTLLFRFHTINFNTPLFLLNVSIFSYLAGLCMITAISVERCLSVLWPIWYRCQRPRHLSSVICALLWALTLLLSLLLGNSCGFFISYYNHSFCRTYNFITAAFLTVLFVALCGSNLALLVRIFCGSQRIPVTRLYVIIAFTTLFFILFCVPFGIYWFFLDWIVALRRVLPCRIHVIITLLPCVNSCANPIIYFVVGSIRHHRFQRQSLKILLQRAMQDTPEEESGERGSSGTPGEGETIWCSN